MYIQSDNRTNLFYITWCEILALIHTGTSEDIGLFCALCKCQMSIATTSNIIIMEACNAVEREVDKVLSKFGAINEHAEAVLRDLINHIQSLKKDLEEGKCGIERFVVFFLLQDTCLFDLNFQREFDDRIYPEACILYSSMD